MACAIPGTSTAAAACRPDKYAARADTAPAGYKQVAVVSARVARGKTSESSIDGPHVVLPPHLVLHVPLRRKHKIIVAEFRKVPLFPRATVGERDIFFAEGDQRVRFREITQDGLRMRLGVLYDVCHQCALPARVNILMARLAGGRSDEGLLRRRRRFLMRCGARSDGARGTSTAAQATRNTID